MAKRPQGIRVLLVEGPRAAAHPLHQALARLGQPYILERAADSAELQVRLAEAPWDAVLADADLPEAPPLELLRIVRLADPFLPVLLLADTLETARAVEAMRHGAADILLAGEWHRLPEALAQALAQAEARRTEGATQGVLADSERRLRDLIEGSIEGIMIRGPERALFANQALADIFGYDSPEQIRALDTVDRLLPEAEAARLRAYHTARVTGGEAPTRYEFEGRRRDGSSVWLACTTRPVTWEGQPAVQTTLIDISSLKAAQFELERFFNLSNEMLQISDLEGRLVRVNPAYAHALGYTPEELVGRPLLELVHPDDVEQTLAVRARLRRSREIVDFENRLCHRDGRSLWVSWRSVFADGLTYAAARDVTQHREAAEALQTSRNLLRTVFDTLPMGIYVKDLESRYVMVNRVMAAHYGHTPEEMVPMATADVPGRTPEDTALFLADDRRVFETGDILHKPPAHFFRADGAGRWMEVIKAPLRDVEGRVQGLVGIQWDVTEIKQAQDELRDSEARFRHLIEGSIQGIRIGQDGHTVFCNQAYAEMLGYDSPEEVMSLPVHASIPEHERERIDQIRAARLRGEEAPMRYTLQLRRKDSSLATVERVSQVVEWNGRPAVQTSNIDITQRTLLEAQLAQAQKLEAVGALAGGVAHDFNNLLTVILSYSEFLLEQLGEQEGPYKDALEIRNTAQRAAALTRQLLAFSRQQVLQLEVLDPNEVVRELHRMLRRLIGEDVELVARLGEDVHTVRADRGQLEQIVLNLAVNARDAMPQGGRLVVETANVTLDRSYAAMQLAAEPGEHVMLAVTDTGVGMSEEVRAHLFEPFFTTKEKGKGTGLGLATVYGIVSQLGGHIWVYSEPGQGTTFKIYLPRVEGTGERAAAEAELPVLPGKEIVLLVEDEQPVRTATARILRKLGYAVLEAASGPEALELAAGHAGEIDLLLTDVVMPHMSGPELERRLREARPGLRTLFTSGYTDDAILHHGVLDGGTALLQKPFSRQNLLESVRKALRAAPAAGEGAAQAGEGER